MLLYLTNYLVEFESGFNVFVYLTLRAILSALTALGICFVIGPRMIERLSTHQPGQPVRSDGPVTHIIKAGYTDDGWCTDTDGDRRQHGSLGGSGEPLHLGGVVRYSGIRRHRIRR